MESERLVMKARLQSTGALLVRLQGRCMDPLFVSGDQAKLMPFTEPSIGCLYLFFLPSGEALIHRLIGKEQGSVRMKGDHSKGFERVSNQSLIGIVAEIKLVETDSWLSLGRSKFIEFLFAYLSAATVKDKLQDKPERFYEKSKRRICAVLLVFFSIILRKHWKRKAYRCSARHS